MNEERNYHTYSQTKLEYSATAEGAFSRLYGLRVVPDIGSEPEDIETIIKSEYRIKCGEELTPESMPFVSEYASGGMSCGKLSGEFWLEKAIPLIKKRNSEL